MPVLSWCGEVSLGGIQPSSPHPSPLTLTPLLVTRPHTLTHTHYRIFQKLKLYTPSRGQVEVSRAFARRPSADNEYTSVSNDSSLEQRPFVKPTHRHNTTPTHLPQLRLRDIIPDPTHDPIRALLNRPFAPTSPLLDPLHNPQDQHAQRKHASVRASRDTTQYTTTPPPASPLAQAPPPPYNPLPARLVCALTPSPTPLARATRATRRHTPVCVGLCARLDLETPPQTPLAQRQLVRSTLCASWLLMGRRMAPTQGRGRWRGHGPSYSRVRVGRCPGRRRGWGPARACARAGARGLNSSSRPAAWRA